MWPGQYSRNSIVPPPLKRADPLPTLVGFSLLGTLQLWDSAKDRARLDEMRACLHDEAVLETVASNGRALGPDRAVDTIRRALQHDRFYLEGPWVYDELESEIVLTGIPVRGRLPSGLLRRYRVHRLTSGSGGLIWRQRICGSRSEALACLDQHGSDLGL